MILAASLPPFRNQCFRYINPTNAKIENIVL